MAFAKLLMGVGLPAEQASRLGTSAPTAVPATGTTNADAAIIGAAATLVTTTGTASTGLKLPAAAEVGQEYVLANMDANAKLIYPPASGQINGDTATTGTVPLPARGTVICMRIDSINWIAVGGAAG